MTKGVAQWEHVELAQAIKKVFAAECPDYFGGSVAIIKVDKRHYRKIAQENWGLTDAQMKGMHVHHRIPRSQGGTNDPSNLYVCRHGFIETLGMGSKQLCHLLS